MTMAVAGVCFSYRAEDGGPLLFGQLGQVRPDGTWSAQPLLPAETVAAALLPLQQNHEDMAALDSDIWLIPLLVADQRLSSALILPLPVIDFEPVLVFNEHCFRRRYALFRSGMTGVYRVAHQFDDASLDRGGLAAFVGEGDFSPSPRRAHLFGGPPTPFCIDMLTARSCAQDELLSVFKFRHALADEVASALRKNAGKAASITLELRTSPQLLGALFAWLPAATSAKVSRSVGKSSNRVSFLVTEGSIHTPSLLKDLVVLAVDEPAVLRSFLGRASTTLRAQRSA